MKKFLSLALALVMTMSLVTISAGATFTDDSDIAYSEAVDVMAAMEIIGGYADGSFSPDGSLTRGAAAKIICNLLLGPTIAAELGTDTAPFPDVAVDHTFAGYIAYCSNEGIINGYANGNFGPSNTVSGYEFMKMLLGALGYDSSIEGYTGTNWSVTVSAKAKTLGLYDDNDNYNGADAITREEACLYALNTLQATLVEYENQSNVTVGDIVISNSSSATKRYESADVELTFMAEYFSKLDNSTGADTTAFGAPAVTWIYKGDEVGTYTDDANLIASYTGKVTNATLYSLLGDDDGDTAVVYVDGKDNAVATYADLGVTSFTENSSLAVGSTGNSSVTEVYGIDDDDNNTTDYYVVVKNTYVVEVTADYDEDDEILEVESVSDAYDLDEDELSIDDFAVSEFEEGDYLLVTATNDSTTLTIESVVAAETISGEVSTYTSGSSVTVDGTKYSYSLKAVDKDETFSVGEEATLILDQEGNVIYVAALTAGSDKYVFVTEFDTSTSVLGSDSIYAAAYFADGTYAAILLDEVYGQDIDTESTSSLELETSTDDCDESALASTDADEKTVNAYNWFTYTTNSDGSYDLLDIDEDYTITSVTAANTNVTNSAVKFDGTTRGDSSTVFVVLDNDDDVYMYTGIANVPSTSGDVTKTYSVMDGSYAQYVFIDASNDAATVKNSNANAADYIFVLDADDPYVDGNGDDVDVYNAIIDGEVTSFDTTGSVTAYTLYEELETDGDYYLVDDTNGKVVDSGSIGAVDAIAKSFSSAEITYSNNVLSVDEVSGSDYDMYVDSDTAIYLVAMKAASALTDDSNADYEVTEMSGNKLNSTMKDYLATGKFHAVFVDDDTSTLSAIYIVVNSVADATPSYAVDTSATLTSGGIEATITDDTDGYEEGDEVTVTINFADGDSTGVANFYVYVTEDISGNYVSTTGETEGTVVDEYSDAASFIRYRINGIQTLSGESVTFTFDMPADDVTIILSESSI